MNIIVFWNLRVSSGKHHEYCFWCILTTFVAADWRPGGWQRRSLCHLRRYEPRWFSRNRWASAVTWVVSVPDQRLSLTDSSFCSAEPNSSDRQIRQRSDAIWWRLWFWCLITRLSNFGRLYQPANVSARHWLEIKRSSQEARDQSLKAGGQLLSSGYRHRR